jgi:hypothetical protein
MRLEMAPADDSTRIQIQNRRQVNEAGSNPDVSDIGDPDLVDSAHLTVLDEVRIYRQRVAGIGRTYKRAPGDGPEPELSHHAAYTFLIHIKTTAFQRASEPPISVARKFLVNAFDLLTQVFILVVTTFSVLFVGFVIKRA